jgi:hypothetical protein
MPSGGCFDRTGTCDGKETMFLRIACRRSVLPGLIGACERGSLWLAAALRFTSSIRCIQKSRLAPVRMA